jgi:hypothetical protein
MRTYNITDAVYASVKSDATAQLNTTKDRRWQEQTFRVATTAHALRRPRPHAATPCFLRSARRKRFKAPTACYALRSAHLIREARRTPRQAREKLFRASSRLIFSAKQICRSITRLTLRTHRRRVARIARNSSDFAARTSESFCRAVAPTPLARRLKWR